MADALVSIPLQMAFEKLAQVVGEQIGLYAGAARELEKMRNTYESIKALLRDAEIRQVAEERVRVWLSKLKGIAHDIEDVVDEWLISGLENDGSNDDAEDKVRTCFPSPCACFNRPASRYKIARQIKEIREKLDQIAGDQKLFNFTINTSLSGETTPGSSRPQTTCLLEESQIIGREEDKEIVIGRLVSGSSSGDADGQQVLVTAIVGIGGLGKTTLARQIYNDGNAQDHFNQALYWVCVSDVFDVIRLTKAILQEVKKASSTLSELNSLQTELHESLRGKRFLLVLDDVWNDDAEKWDMLRLSLKSGAQGSRILVTTRSERVANIMNAAYIHQLKGLSPDLSWTLFSSRAFAGWKAEEHSGLEIVGRQIVSKCSGVPLSIKVMGSAMNSKKTRADWQNILESTIWSLPEVADKILPALILSYYNLPPYLKQCFAYCSIYQKDTKMMKDELVQSWVTHGFIHPQGSRDVEDIAEEYFNHLMAYSMFQEIHEDAWGKTTCKMHDLLHDLAEFIMKDESYIFADENSHSRCSIGVCHASFILSYESPIIPIASFPAKKLRTLFVHGLYEIDPSLVDLFRQARFLRALVLRGCGIEMLPETIGELKHLRYLGLSRLGIVELPNAFEKMQQLRYLDLSRSKIVELPESMSHLVNLHTLNLDYCRQLKKLPGGIGRMVSLRHLQIKKTGSLECLPEGLGKISCLRSLCKFIVGGEGGCGIDELQRLNSLQGSLEIQHLERVSSSEEAEKAELWSKSHLRKLVLRMYSGRDEEIVMSGRNDAERERVENVLDGLRPHPNLEDLELYCYRSSSKLKLPSWMEDSSFSKLTELVIWGFSQCEENLLGLGKLPALKSLQLRDVGVRKMGDEFYYGMSSNDVVGKRRVSFPKLEYLSLWLMDKLEEWELALEADDVSEVMPSLQKLHVDACPKLQGLPDSLGKLESLEKLLIFDCQKLGSLPHSLGQLRKLKLLKIKNAEALTCLPESLGQLESIEELTVNGCKKLVSLPHSLGQLKKLKSLEIIDAESLTCMPESLGQLESLEQLKVGGSEKLVSLPHSLGQLQKLKYLSITDAVTLTCLPDSLGNLQSLENLFIDGCQKLASLPHSLGQLQKLKYLSIKDAVTLTCLPDSLGQLGSLEGLGVVGCQKLVSLPHSLGQLKALNELAIEQCEALESLPHALQDLSRLRELSVYDCPQLSERCKREGGEDWPKISHITDIIIDGQKIN